MQTDTRTVSHILLETDAALVAEVAAHNPELAHRVQLRLRALRLRLVAGQVAAPGVLQNARHSIWHSLRWPWRQRG